jgi:cell wall-associated NlpC family hydrolase
MKHLFFVSVAVGIFSGTSISAQGQASVNSVGVKEAKSRKKKSPKFIEGIEIRPEGGTASRTVIMKSEELITVNQPANTAVVTNSGSTIEGFSSAQFKYAQLLNVEVESLVNSGLYTFIEKWWGSPYRYGGATQQGVDCSAYTGTLIHDVYGIVLSRTARSQYEACYKIKKDDLQEGDLVFFNTRRGVSHVGVYLRNGYFTHASVGGGVTISNLDETYYTKRYIGGGRIQAITNTNAE